jgi:hypothetical protein
MITDRFGALLEELGQAMKLKLAPDSHNACRIRFPDKLAVHLSPDKVGEYLNIVIEIGNPGEGKYKENVFREALRANGLPGQRNGIFCYGPKKDILLLYDTITFEDVHGQRLFDIIQTLCQKAREWKDALSRGEIPPYRSGAAGVERSPGNIFGIR